MGSFIPIAQPQASTIYGLAIIKPDGVSVYEWINFPLSPENLRKEYDSMSQTFMTLGSSQQNGINRIADIYGVAPPRFTISGHTGVSRNSSTGYTLTGLEIILNLIDFLQSFGRLNAVQVAAGKPLYTMEFYDYFQNSFWSVVPIGPQVFTQDSGKPLLNYYKFQLDGIADVSGTPAVLAGEADALLQQFGTPVAQAAANAAISLAGIYNLYEPGVVSQVNTLTNAAGNVF